MANEIIKKIYIDPAEKHDLGGYAENILMDIPEENQDVSEIKNVKEAIEDIATIVDEEKANNSIYNDNFISRKAFMVSSEEYIENATDATLGHGSIEYLLATVSSHSGKGAKGEYSQAFGHEVLANGNYSHAEGDGSTANGIASHAENSGIAHGDYSHAEGDSSIYNADYAHAEGKSSIYNGANYSHAEGKNTAVRSGSIAAHAEGEDTEVSNEAAHAEGLGTIASGIASHAEGKRDTSDIGEEEQTPLGAAGEASHSEGYNTSATGKNSHAEGNKTIANGDYSHAEGYNTEANGNHSHSEGCNTKANGTFSHSGGYNIEVSGSSAFGHGYNSKVKGDFCIGLGPDMDINSSRIYALGRGIKTSSGAAEDVTYLGNFPIMSTGEDRIIFGIGTDESNRKNGFQISKNGNAYMDNGGLKTKFIELWFGTPSSNTVQITCDYYNPNTTGQAGYCVKVPALRSEGRVNALGYDTHGSDYAEHFYEWDEIPKEKIGYFVTCKNKKLYKANSNDSIIGITSNTYGLLGTKEGANENWTPVGIMGQIPVKDDGTCEEGKYCKCADGGIATLATERSFDTWLVLERIDSNTVLVLFK